jgi:hypothetical protein
MSRHATEEIPDELAWCETCVEYVDRDEHEGAHEDDE